MRTIVTLICLKCKNSWVAPDLKSKVKCHKCHSDKISKDRPRVEDAPIV